MNSELLKQLALLKEAVEAVDFFLGKAGDSETDDPKWLRLKSHLYANAMQLRDFSIQDYELWSKLNEQRLDEPSSQKDDKP